MPIWKAVVLGFLFGLVIVVLAHAEPVPQLTNRVMDPAGVLVPAKQDIARRLDRLATSRHIQMVVFFPTSLNGEDIATFAGDVTRKWGVGSKGKDNGLLLVIAVKERKIRLEVGYGLEGDIPDAKAAIILTKMKPSLASKNWGGAVNTAIDEIENVMKVVY